MTSTESIKLKKAFDEALNKKIFSETSKSFYMQLKRNVLQQNFHNQLREA